MEELQAWIGHREEVSQKQRKSRKQIMEVALGVGAVHRTAKEDAVLAEAVHSVDGLPEKRSISSFTSLFPGCRPGAKERHC